MPLVPAVDCFSLRVSIGVSFRKTITVRVTPLAIGTRAREALVSLWDFAGQFVYCATHQLFFSPRCVYLLVINLDDDLDRTLEDWYFDIRGKQSIEVQGNKQSLMQ